MAKALEVIECLVTDGGACPASFEFCGGQGPWCEMQECGSGANPTIFVTLSWTSNQCQLTYLSCDFYNGETKEVHPTSYLKVKFTGVSPSFAHQYTEEWTRGAGNNKLRLTADNNEFFGPRQGAHNVDVLIDVDGKRGVSGSVYYNSVYTAGTDKYFYTFGAAGFAAPGPFGHYLQDDQFGSFTTTEGITVTWARGNGF